MSDETETSTPPRGRNRLDPLSLAAITVICLAIAIFATVVIIEVFGTSEDEAAVDVSDALEEAPEGGSLEVGDPVPTLEVELLGGGSVSTDEFTGSPLVVNFWSSTCAPCLSEMPDFEAVHGETAGEVAFLGIDVTDTEEAGREMVERTGVTYPNGRDPRGEVLRAFGGTALPRTVLVDDGGTVVDIHNGPLTEEELTAALADAGMTP